MIFGDKSDFAIQAMIEPYLMPPSEPWGRLCVWVAGTQIGDFEDPHCSLYSCYTSFQEMCEQLDYLWTDEFQGLSDRDIWNLLDGALYGHHGNIVLDDKKTLEECLIDSERYYKFNFLTNWGTMFDHGGKSFILKSATEHLKILRFDYKQETVSAHTCTKFSFLRATKGFTEWYCRQEELLKA